MPVYDIYFDSRDRIGGIPCDATFQLTHPLSNVRSVYCKSFQFQNTFENITSTTNKFEIATLNAPTLITIPPGMYDAQKIITTLNQLMAPYVSVSLSGNLLSWNTRYRIQNISTTVLGFPAGLYTPGTPTVLSLASLSYVSLSSLSIQPVQRPVATSPGLFSTPLITCPVTTEFGFVQSNIEFFPSNVICNNHALQNIAFQVTDPYSKRPLLDLQSWAAQICFQAD